MALKVTVIAALAFMLTGCSSGSGVKVWNPMTWWSGHSAVVVDKAGDKVEQKKVDALEAAHVEVLKTGEVLAVAPESRPVELARRFNTNAGSLLDQSLGAVPTKELQELRSLVKALTSDVATVRASAEAQQAKSEHAQAELAESLADARKRLGDAQGKLRDAFDRENALANELRNERLMRWGFVGLAIVCAIGWAYVRYVAGGLPAALGKMMATAERKSPALADDLRALLDAHTNRNEQNAIAAHYAKSR